MGAKADEDTPSPTVAPMEGEALKVCNDFNKDFPGDSYALIEDLSSRFNLNVFALSKPPNVAEDPRSQYLQVFNNLMSPNFKFSDQLEQRGIDRDKVVAEVRDYIDKQDVDESGGGSETAAYQSAELDYGPAQRPMEVVDELKLIPSIDDFLYNYLKDKVSVLPNTKEAKINLNNVSADVFQALLRNRSGNDEELARQFVKDRTENNRIYDAETYKERLQEAGFPLESLYEELLGTQTEAYLVTARATVGETEVAIEAVIRNPRMNTRSNSRENSVIIQRVLP
jgi:type II secretory pathway component PulK